MRMKHARTMGFVVAVTLCACGTWAEERTVSTAQELYEALLALNSGSDTGNVIYLEPGSYDVSDYAMKRWDRTAISSETLSHLALAHVKITGKTENPRDTVIYCNGTNRVIHSQISRIENLTVSNGWHNSGTGGAGVLSYNATSDNQKSFHSNVVVTCCTSAAAGGGVYYGVWYDSVITSNRMTNAGSGGGGVSGTECHNCEISNNESLGIGGAGYYQVTLYGCRVLNNFAKKNGGGLSGSSCYGSTFVGNRSDSHGGACSGTFVGEGTVISNNVAGGEGGGLHSCAGEATNVTICCNCATNSGGGVSGGIYRNCDIYGNTGKYGGGVCNAECHNCDIHDNSSAGYGGGVYYDAKLYDCRVFGNASAAHGGGVSSSGSATHACHIHGGVISNNTSVANGGGVYFCILHGGTQVCYNKSSGSGGGGYNGEGTAATNTIFFCNESNGDLGGGFAAYKSLVTGCIISNNFLNVNMNKQVAGGGLYAGASLVRDSKIVFNRIANDSDGSDSRAYGAGTNGGALSNCVISGNAVIKCGTRHRQGGGCYSSVLTNCIVADNFVYDGLGMGINGGSAYGCIISNNATTGKAPAVRSTTHLENCEIFGPLTSPKCMVNCRVVDFTNGVVIAEGANVYTNGCFLGCDYLCEGEAYVTNCLFAGNVTRYSIFRPVNTQTVSVVNCTVTGNTTERMFYDATPSKNYAAEAVNCIFTGNKWNGADRNMWYDSAHTNITLRNCLIGSGRVSYAPLSETGTITNDNPKFVKDGSRDAYALKRNSPAVGKGLVQVWMADALDIRADEAFPRLRDGAVDIGCYQCWLDPIGFSFSIR